MAFVVGNSRRVVGSGESSNRMPLHFMARMPRFDRDTERALKVGTRRVMVSIAPPASVATFCGRPN